MKKLSVIMLFATLLALLPAFEAVAAVIQVRNYTLTEYSMGYDSWFLGIKSSHSADIAKNNFTEVSAPFMGSFGEIRIYKKGESSNPLWKATPWGTWLPTRGYVVWIQEKDKKTTFSLTDK